MSYDIFVQDVPANATSIADIPGDFTPRGLGPRAPIVEAIRRAAPGVVFDETGWGAIDAPDYSIAVSLAVEDPVQSFAFHVRSGQESLFVVATILDDLGYRAVVPDTETASFQSRMTRATPTSGARLLSQVTRPTIDEH
jgi:hypothetical protein